MADEEKGMLKSENGSVKSLVSRSFREKKKKRVINQEMIKKKKKDLKDKIKNDED